MHHGPSTCGRLVGWRRLAAAALAAAVASPALAQDGWVERSQDVSAPVAAPNPFAFSQPLVGADAQGNAIAAWVEPYFASNLVTVRAARYSRSTGTFRPPATLSLDELTASVTGLSVDRAGNALVMFQYSDLSGSGVRVKRYNDGAAAWSDQSVSTDFAVTASALAMAPSGDAVACWSTGGIATLCRRFNSNAATWSNVDSLPAASTLEGVTMDDSGNIVVLLTTPPGAGTDVRVVRFDAASAAWSAPVDIVVGLATEAALSVALAGGAAGAALVTWSDGVKLMASRSAASAGVWTSPVAVATVGPKNEFARAAIAASGDITVAWLHSGATTGQVQVARYLVATDAWTAPLDLPGQPYLSYGPPAIAVDSGGSVHVAWSQVSAFSGVPLAVARFSPAAGQWTTATNLSDVTRVASTPSLALDAGGSAMVVWVSTVGGNTKILQAVRWVATLGPPAFASLSPSAGAAEIDLFVPKAIDPAYAPTNLEYSLDDGATWVPRTPASPSSPLVLSGLVDGTPYPLRVRTVNRGGSGGGSRTVRFRSGTDIAPSRLRLLSRVGNTLTLAWNAPRAGVEPFYYVLEGGLAGQTTVLGRLATGAVTQTSLAVPNGNFFLQVTAASDLTRFGTTAPLTIAVNTDTAPTAPVGMLGSVSGSTLVLSWRNTFEGATPTAVRLSVSGTLSGEITLPLSETFTFAGVPSGTYTFTMSTLAGAVASASSAPVTLTFPGACSGAPLPPSDFSATTQSGRIYLDWLPPASGEAVTSYTVSVSGAFTGTFPMATRTLDAPAPAGTYVVRVASVGICGASAFTAAQTIVVP